MPEDPITQDELAALARRFEEVAAKNDREFGIVKSDMTTARLQVGNLDQNVDRLEGRLQEFGQAQIVKLLTRPVGQDPNAS